MHNRQAWKRRASVRRTKRTGDSLSTIERSSAGSGCARVARRLAVWLGAALAVMLVAAAGYLGATRAAMLQLHEAQGHRLDVV